MIDLDAFRRNCRIGAMALMAMVTVLANGPSRADEAFEQLLSAARNARWPASPSARKARSMQKGLQTHLHPIALCLLPPPAASAQVRVMQRSNCPPAGGSRRRRRRRSDWLGREHGR